MRYTLSAVNVQRALLLGALCGFLMVPSGAIAAPALVQGFGVSGAAAAGNTAAAGILVLVSDPVTGIGIANLGASIPVTGPSISLPTGWTLFRRFGGCIIEPIGFTNQGNGSYFIDIRPDVLSCSNQWLNTLEYGFTVKITNAGATLFEGIGLVSLEINP